MAVIKGWKTNKDLFNEKKEQHKEYLSYQCQEAILAGFDMEINGEVYHFSYDREAQINMQERWQLFQNSMIETIRITAHTKDGQDVRIEFDKESFNKLYLASVQHKENNIQRLREELFPLVDTAVDEEDLQLIQWDVHTVEPVEGPIKLKDDKLLSKEVDGLKVDAARSTNELMSLIMISNMEGLV